MEIKKLNINNNEYEFVNEFKSTRNGFKHITTLFLNGYKLGDATINYINRTWEMYEYQSVMKKVVNELIHEIETDFIEHYKSKHNISRLTSKTKNTTEFEVEKMVFINNSNFNDFMGLKLALDRRV
jgi:transcription antitermination factor NusG